MTVLFTGICKASTSVPTAADTIKIFLLHDESVVFACISRALSLSLSVERAIHFVRFEKCSSGTACYTNTRKSSRVGNPLMHRSDGSAYRNEIFCFFYGS